MKNTVITRAITLLLIGVFVVPMAFFTAPERASAQVSTLLSAAGCFGLTTAGAAKATAGLATSVLSVPVADQITRLNTTVAAGGASQDCMQNSILMPLARMLAKMILQQITASTINWINGSNGTGQTSYVQNLSLHLQGVGDSSAFAFLGQLSTGLASPFASAITSSLRLNYLQQTSVAGFFAANQDTLRQTSPNINSFLAGDWSQGGIASWMALTTQNQNNPYTLYPAAQAQLASVVAGATSARQQELSWGNGFLSWCSVTDAAAQTQSSASSAYQACQASGKSGAECQAAFDAAGGNVGGASTGAGGSCTNADGTPGKTLTPGSIIHDYTQQAVVNSGINQLVSANDLDSALGAIISALGKQVLGAAGGLFGASQPVAGRPAIFTTQLQAYSANSAAAASSNPAVQSVTSQVGNYITAWNTISSAADTASTNLKSLVDYCTSQISLDNAPSATITTQIAAAQTALSSEVSPVVTQAQTAIGAVAATKAFALQVQAEDAAMSSAPVGSTAAANQLSADLQTLAGMPPVATEVISAQQNASVTGGAKANPDGSLTVSGGTLVDQMNLISANATALKASCTAPTP